MFSARLGWMHDVRRSQFRVAALAMAALAAVLAVGFLNGCGSSSESSPTAREAGEMREEGGGAPVANSSDDSGSASATDSMALPDAVSRLGGDASGGPAPPSNWVNVTGNLAGMASECGNLTLMS